MSRYESRRDELESKHQSDLSDLRAKFDLDLRNREHALRSLFERQQMELQQEAEQALARKEAEVASLLSTLNDYAQKSIESEERENMLASEVRCWPAWKCCLRPCVGSHPGTPTQPFCRSRCAVGPPGNASFVRRVPHTQTHPPPSSLSGLSLTPRSLPLASPSPPLQSGRITKPLVAWVMGTCASIFPYEVRRVVLPLAPPGRGPSPHIQAHQPLPWMPRRCVIRLLGPPGRRTPVDPGTLTSPLGPLPRVGALVPLDSVFPPSRTNVCRAGVPGVGRRRSWTG